MGDKDHFAGINDQSVAFGGPKNFGLELERSSIL
jgi:hypothetical protein